MYKHLLIATDGSELAQKAVAQGFALANAVNAKVTIVTVSEPWAPAAPAEVAIVYPIEDYERAAAAQRKQDLSGCLCCWREIANHLRHRSRQRGISRRGYRRNCARARLRFNRDVIAWPSRSDAPRAGQSGPSRRNAEHDVGFDLPMKARIRLSAQPYRAWLARA